MTRPRDQMTTLELLKEQRDEAQKRNASYLAVSRAMQDKYDHAVEFIKSKGLADEFIAYRVAHRLEEANG